MPQLQNKAFVKLRPIVRLERPLRLINEEVHVVLNHYSNVGEDVTLAKGIKNGLTGVLLTILGQDLSPAPNVATLGAVVHDVGP